MSKARMAVLRGPVIPSGDEAGCLKGAPASLEEYLFINGREQVLARQIKQLTGHTPASCLIFAALHQKKNVKQGELVELTGIDRSTLGNCVARMVDKGLLLQEVREADERSRALTLTISGAAAARKVVRHLGTIK